MQTLIGNAKILTKNRSLIKKVANTCEVYINVSKHNPLSVVALTKTEDFNQIISIDLHKLSTSLCYMHFLAEFTRYSAAVFVINKVVCH